MPILLLIILVVLIAQFGFWNTFAAVIGAAAMMGIFVILIIAALAIVGMMILRRL